ncbi:MAG: hypothetical protein ACKO96_00255, partial [Flammeovirgaceae bacterium]
PQNPKTPTKFAVNKIMKSSNHNSKLNEFVVDADKFDVREAIIGTYKHDKEKDYLLPDTNQPHKGLEMFLQSDLNFELAESILDYTRYLNSIDKKKRQLE